MGEMENESKPKEMKHLIYICLSLIACVLPAQNDSIFSSEITPMQQEIIAKLTGKKPIKDSLFLKQRATVDERKVTVDYLSDCLKKLGLVVDNHHYKTTNGNPFIDLLFLPLRGINVSATLPATTDSNTYIVFGGHYDSERGSPGAIDNATGIALSLAIAYKLSQLKERPYHFIVVFFDQEEDDEIGSKAYAKLLKRSTKKVHSVHTLDMVGWDENGNNGLELELPPPALETVYRKVAEIHNIPVYSTKVSSSDHKSFIDQGFDALGISEEYVKGDTTPYYHSPEDTYNTVNFKFLATSTHFIFQVFKTLMYD